MRAFERQPDESEKAYRAFCCYRDAGADRTLARAAESYYGFMKNLAQIGVWSSRFAWVERARSYDDWKEFIGRAAVEEHMREGAEDRARREAAIIERDLKLREMAQQQAEVMLRWPVSTQERIVTEDGEEVHLVVTPTSWSKATAIALRNMSLGDRTEPEQPGARYDLDALDDHELEAFVSYLNKLESAPLLSPERPER